MAKSATVYKLKLEISDLDKNYFQHHELTIACHPSETAAAAGSSARYLAFP